HGEFTSRISTWWGYQGNRSPAGIFFGYHRSTKPGSDQLAVPTRILPVVVLAEDFLVTHQRSHTRRRTQIKTATWQRGLFAFGPNGMRAYQKGTVRFPFRRNSKCISRCLS